MAAKFFTGLPLDGPDPECVKGHGEQLLATVDQGAVPRATQDHSRRSTQGKVLLGLPSVRVSQRPCNESPIADLS